MEDREEVSTYLSEQLQGLASRKAKLYLQLIEYEYIQDPQKYEALYGSSRYFHERIETQINQLTSPAPEESIKSFRSILSELSRNDTFTRNGFLLDTLPLDQFQERDQRDILMTELYLLQEAGLGSMVNFIGATIDGFYGNRIYPHHIDYCEDTSKAALYMSHPLFEVRERILPDKIHIYKDGKRIDTSAAFLQNPSFGSINFDLSGKGKYAIHAEFSVLNYANSRPLFLVDTLEVR